MQPPWQPAGRWARRSYKSLPNLLQRANRPLLPGSGRRFVSCVFSIHIDFFAPLFYAFPERRHAAVLRKAHIRKNINFKQLMFGILKYKSHFATEFFLIITVFMNIRTVIINAS